MEQINNKQKNTLQSTLNVIQLLYNKSVIRGGGIRTIHTPMVTTGETRETQEKCTPAE